MGCGKSSVGRRLSQLLCCPFMDLDEVIEKEAGKTIPEIFADEGEAGFRVLEKTVLTSVLSGNAEEVRTFASLTPPHRFACGYPAFVPRVARSLPSSAFLDRTDEAIEEGTGNKTAVISLGGGTVMTRECAELVHTRTLCIYLRASVETLVSHLEGETSNRPMLSGNLKDRITELMSQRSSTYESIAHIILDIDGQTVEEPAGSILSLLPQP